MESPSFTVTCPTATPCTSVIAFRGPGAKMPGATPSSRARGRAPCAAADCVMRRRRGIAAIAGRTPKEYRRLSFRTMAIVPLFGHDELRARLSDAMSRQALPASLLLQGPRGVGKQRLGLWLGQLLLCERPTTEPCGK